MFALVGCAVEVFGWTVSGIDLGQSRSGKPRCGISAGMRSQDNVIAATSACAKTRAAGSKVIPGMSFHQLSGRQAAVRSE